MLNRNNLITNLKIKREFSLNKKLDFKIKKLKSLKMLFSKNVYVLNINLTLNNIYVTVTDSSGKVFYIGSGGLLKLKNVKRNTTYVMQLLLVSLLRKIQKKKVKFIILRINNLTKKYKKLILKYFFQFNIRLLCIQNSFSIAYNGVRLRKQRRL